MATPARHREFHFWSVALGDYACRLSVPDKRGGEHFTIVAKPSSGRQWRDTRAQAVEALCEVADAGLEPGEYVIGDNPQYPRSPFVAQARQDAATERARHPTGGEVQPAHRPAVGASRPDRSASNAGRT
jgi:hypothetical protein